MKQQLIEWEMEIGTQFVNREVYITDIPNSTTMGQCYARTFGYTIEMDVKTMKMNDWLVKSVLWHEFCHAWAYSETGRQQMHNKEFKKRFHSKPFYWFGDCIAKLMFIFY